MKTDFYNIAICSILISLFSANSSNSFNNEGNLPFVLAYNEMSSSCPVNRNIQNGIELLEPLEYSALSPLASYFYF
jgi:hypothetical protein